MSACGESKSDDDDHGSDQYGQREWALFRDELERETLANGVSPKSADTVFGKELYMNKGIVIACDDDDYKRVVSTRFLRKDTLITLELPLHGDGVMVEAMVRCDKPLFDSLYPRSANATSFEKTKNNIFDVFGTGHTFSVSKLSASFNHSDNPNTAVANVLFNADFFEEKDKKEEKVLFISAYTIVDVQENEELTIAYRRHRSDTHQFIGDDSPNPIALNMPDVTYNMVETIVMQTLSLPEVTLRLARQRSLAL